MFRITKEEVRKNLFQVLNQIVGKTLAKKIDEVYNLNNYSLVDHTYNTLVSFEYEKAKEDFFSMMFDKDFLDTKIDGIKKQDLLKLSLLYHDFAKVFDDTGYHGETAAKELSKINDKKSLLSKLTRKQKDYVLKLIESHDKLTYFAFLSDNPQYRKLPVFEERLKDIYRKTREIAPELAFITLANHKGKAEPIVFELDRLELLRKMVNDEEPPKKIKYNMMLNYMYDVIEDVVLKYTNFINS